MLGIANLTTENGAPKKRKNRGNVFNERLQFLINSKYIPAAVNLSFLHADPHSVTVAASSTVPLGDTVRLARRVYEAVGCQV